MLIDFKGKQGQSTNHVIKYIKLEQPRLTCGFILYSIYGYWVQIKPYSADCTTFCDHINKMVIDFTIIYAI